MTLNIEQKQQLVTILAKRLLNLEFQINNQDQLSKRELKEVIATYEGDRDSLMQLILAKAKEMGYPEMNKWSDTKPMGEISKLSNHLLAGTEAYQEILGAIIMR